MTSSVASTTKIFFWSTVVGVVCLALAGWWNGLAGVGIALLLIVMEIGFSFDNAVVNAAVLKTMDEKWQQRFLTWGMVIAVFGMYALFPILIVSVATGLGFGDVISMALHDQATYGHHLEEAHTQIASFGGMFLLMVFLKFILDEGKELHWLGAVEEKLSKLGKLESLEVVLALGIVLGLHYFLPEDKQIPEMVAGVFGVITYVLISSVTGLLQGDGAVTAARTGLAGFIYLQVLDATFSMDAVVGAFAISTDIVIIMLGLTTGAMFVRSITVYLVRKGTLSHYVYLEHGAHYGIGALALILLYSTIHHVPEAVTGLIGIGFIALSLVSSVKHNRANSHC